MNNNFHNNIIMMKATKTVGRGIGDVSRVQNKDGTITYSRSKAFVDLHKAREDKRLADWHAKNDENTMLRKSIGTLYTDNKTKGNLEKSIKTSFMII